MKHVLTKISHRQHALDGRVLETRSYLPHDLMHFAFANITGSNEGFFIGQQNMEREEMIVGALQGILRDSALLGERFDPDTAIADLRKYILDMGMESPVLTPDLLQKVFDEYAYLMKRWQSLRTGESIVIDLS